MIVWNIEQYKLSDILIILEKKSIVLNYSEKLNHYIPYPDDQTVLASWQLLIHTNVLIIINEKFELNFFI